MLGGGRTRFNPSIFYIVRCNESYRSHIEVGGQLSATGSPYREANEKKENADSDAFVGGTVQIARNSLSRRRSEEDQQEAYPQGEGSGH